MELGIKNTGKRFTHFGRQIFRKDFEREAAQSHIQSIGTGLLPSGRTVRSNERIEIPPPGCTQGSGGDVRFQFFKNQDVVTEFGVQAAVVDGCRKFGIFKTPPLQLDGSIEGWSFQRPGEGGVQSKISLKDGFRQKGSKRLQIGRNTGLKAAVGAGTYREISVETEGGPGSGEQQIVHFEPAAAQPDDRGFRCGQSPLPRPQFECLDIEVQIHTVRPDCLFTRKPTGQADLSGQDDRISGSAQVQPWLQMKGRRFDPALNEPSLFQPRLQPSLHAIFPR